MRDWDDLRVFMAVNSAAGGQLKRVLAGVGVLTLVQDRHDLLLPQSSLKQPPS